MSLNFLDDLNSNSGKKKYQKFTVNIGIEKFDVIVPFENSASFELSINESLQSSSKFKQATLIDIASKFNGTVKASK